MIAALFVMADGVYSGLPDVDPWDAARDARLYRGPHPVVAHPPCERWGNYWQGGPTSERTPRELQLLGDDGGCFAAALWAVRTFGGVLEHPRGSRAWQWFGLREPVDSGGWTSADRFGGWTCNVEQGWYGHRSQKSTWLYAARVIGLPSLRWGSSPWSMPVERLGRRERMATPAQFRDLLLGIARSITEDHDHAAKYAAGEVP